MEPEKYLIVKKAKNGKGIFTTRPLAQGQKIFEVKGVRLHFSKTSNAPGPLQDNTFRISRDYYLSPQGYIGDYLNHSCMPNIAVFKRGAHLYTWAIRNIEPSEELLLDYSTILAKDDIWTMRCNCGTSQCRKIIRTYTSLPKALLAHYKKAGILPRYIANISS